MFQTKDQITNLKEKKKSGPFMIKLITINSWPFEPLDGLGWSMFWHSQCFGILHVLVQMIFGMVYDSIRSISQHGLIIGTVYDFLRLMFWCGQCFGMVDV